MVAILVLSNGCQNLDITLLLSAFLAGKSYTNQKPILQVFTGLPSALLVSMHLPKSYHL